MTISLVNAILLPIANCDSASPPAISYRTETRLTLVNVEDGNILKIIKSLVHKVPGSGDDSLRMLKTCDSTVIPKF